MSNVISMDVDGVSVTIDAGKFKNLYDQAFEHLAEIESNNQSFKDVVEDIADETKLEKAMVSKYLKARYAAKTKAAKTQGEVFAAIDGMLDN